MKLEMRTLKNIAAAAMTLAVVFGAASLKPVTANAAEASVSASIEEENSYISFQDEAYQNEFLRRVNNERAKAGLKPVQLGDSSHNNAAQERAKELASSYSYVRPNGQRDFTIFAENGIEDVSIGEDYMAGVSTPDAAVDQWMNIDFTRERILNADATTMSVGHYEGGIYKQLLGADLLLPRKLLHQQLPSGSSESGQCRACKVRPAAPGHGRCKAHRSCSAARRRDRNRQFSRSSQWYQVVHCSQRVRRDGCRCWRECRMGQRFS